MDNKVADALSRKLCTLQSLSAKVIGFECLIHEYPTCRDFGEIYTFFTKDPPTIVEGFTIAEGFLFRGIRLCISDKKCDHWIWKMHVGGVAGHFGHDKTIILVEEDSIG